MGYHLLTRHNCIVIGLLHPLLHARIKHRLDAVWPWWACDTSYPRTNCKVQHHPAFLAYHNVDRHMAIACPRHQVDAANALAGSRLPIAATVYVPSPRPQVLGLHLSC